MNKSKPHGGVLYRYRFGSAEFDEARFELRVDDRVVELEQRPLDVLAILLRHADEVVSKEELLDTVWVGRVTVEHVLTNAIAKLRKGLGGANAGHILTQPKAGYRFAGPVERVAVGRQPENRLALKVGQAVPGRAHFVLKEQLMGTRNSEVWLARHSKTGERRVYKFSPDGQRLGVLKREVTLSRVLRDSLGERDDFTRIIDWNFESPPFFLECEYGGTNLLEWSQQEERLARLPADGRLQLAIQIINAVAAAHDAGVLHKDLKPANVLVASRQDGSWQIRITDFGAGGLQAGRIAELAVTPHGLTLDQHGSDSHSLGTPLYIAPEIIAGAAPTVRSDIYSLGVLLYQLLAGDLRKPLTTGWEADIPSNLLREDITLATHGDPARRLSSAAALAERLLHLETRSRQRKQLEQAEQRAVAANRQLERLRARRPWLLATLFVLGAGLTISLWQFQRADEATKLAQIQAARAEATGLFLTDLLIKADPHRPDGSGAVTVREALDRASASIGSHFAADPATEAAIRTSAGNIYAGLADYAAAAQHRQRAAQLMENLYGSSDKRTMISRYQLAEALTNASDYQSAQAVLEAMEPQIPGLAHDPELAFVAAKAKARFHLLKAEIEPAAEWLETALTLGRQQALADAETLYRLQMDLSQCYSRLGRYDAAVNLLAELLSQDPGMQEISAAARASAQLYHGAALLYASRYLEAEPALLKAVETLTEVFGADSSRVLEAQSSLGNLYATSGRWQEALPVIQRVREGMCEQHGALHLMCMMSLGNQGVIELQLGQITAAINKLQAARDAFEAQLGPASPGVHVLGYYLARARLENGEAGAAASLTSALDPLKLESGSPGEQWSVRVAGLQAWVLIAQGHPEQGRPRLEQAVAEMQAGNMQPWIVAPYQRALTPGLAATD